MEAVTTKVATTRVASLNEVDILHYDCARLFLRDAIAARRQRRSQFGLRQLAKKSTIASPSLLSLIISGKRALTERCAQKIADGLNLKGRRKKYFIYLGKLTTTKSDDEIQRIKDQLVRIKSSVDASLLESKQYRFLADWFYTVIYVMVGLDNFQTDPEWISEKLKRSVTRKDIEQALKDLADLQLVRKEGERWQQVHRAISTSDDLRDSALFLYHSHMIQKARESLHISPSMREFNGVTVTVPKDQIPEVKKRMREFRRSLNEYLSQFTQPADVFQINLQMFPLTEGLEAP